MLLPVMDNFNADEVKIPRQLPDKAWRISGGRMTGFVDELDAVRQAAWKRLSTEAGRYDIYDGAYGMKKVDLIGAEVDYALSELHRRIRDSLLRDDRIMDAVDFIDAVDKRKVSVSFTVSSIYGQFGLWTEVRI